MTEAFRMLLAAGAAVLLAGPALAQGVLPAGDFRTCPADQAQAGRVVVLPACGAIEPPDVQRSFATLAELQAAQAARDSFNRDVAAYGDCVTEFINQYRRPGADASSRAPDQAACAHAWAEHQATELVRSIGHACIDFSNRTMVDARLEPWSGDCFPKAEGVEG